MSFENGTVIGDYEIVGVLGTGGMGKVYKVRNTISDRMEAMKVLLPNLDVDQELVERFLREIKVQAALQHPNIASLRTAQRVNNQLLMIMEFVEGSTLESIMRQGHIPLQDCVKYGSQVLSALAYAHGRGVVHRDIKPPNIMLTPEGVIKLMDFGIAKLNADRKLTQTGKTVGSLFYMSPEQIRGSEVDGRSDLYSFGITLYEMVTGRRPFVGDSDYSIMAAHLQQPPQPPVFYDASLPQALNDVILMSIAKDPAERFQTADAFRNALESVVKGVGVGGAAGAGTGAAGTQIFSRPGPPPPPPPPMGQAMAPPPVMAQAMPSPAPPPAQYAQAAAAQAGRSHRGLYMVLGSVVTIGILAGAAVYVPKLLKTRASGDPAQTSRLQPPSEKPLPTPPPQVAPAQVPAAQVSPTQVSPTQVPATQVPEPQAAPPKQIALAPQRPSNPRPTSTGQLGLRPAQSQTSPPVQQQPASPTQQQMPPPQQAPAAPPQTTTAAPAANPANAAALEELNQRRTLMISRVEAINASMSRLEQQQRQMGLGMSGDLVARQHRMVSFLEAADAAMRRRNVDQARTNLDNAERELDKLEEHFGR